MALRNLCYFDRRCQVLGKGSDGQLGYEDQNDRGDDAGEMGDNLLPVDLGSGKTAKQIIAGQLHTCALLNDNTVKCWGQGGYGQLGYEDNLAKGDGVNEMGNNLGTIDLGTGKTAKQISGGEYYTCALLNDDDSLKCWGMNFNGQLGYGDADNRGDQANEMGDNLASIDLGAGKTTKEVFAGSYHTCAILNDDSVKCWGSGHFGRLGSGNTQDRGDGANEMGDNLPVVDLGFPSSVFAYGAKHLATFHASNTSYARSPCSGQEDCQAKCAEDVGCEGFTVTQGAVSFSSQNVAHFRCAMGILGVCSGCRW